MLLYSVMVLLGPPIFLAIRVVAVVTSPSGNALSMACRCPVCGAVVRFRQRRYIFRMGAARETLFHESDASMEDF
jgi:hypothetical protein